MGLIIYGKIKYDDTMVTGYSSPIYLTNPDEIKSNPDAYQNVFTYPAIKVVGSGDIYCVTYISEVSGTQRISVIYFSRLPFSVDRYNQNVYNDTFNATLRQDSDIGDYYFFSNIFLDYVSSYDTIPSALNYYTGSESFDSRLVAKYVLTGVYDNDNDPYERTGTAVHGGGNGTFDFINSDDITFPSLPDLSAIDTGMVSLWSPTVQQMLDLTAFLWNADPTTISFWKKLIANPLDLIYGLSIIPVDFRATGMDILDGTGTVVVGLINTYIAMDKVSRQWLEVDCGSITIDETWGAYLDYDPFTKLEIYLPFCGTHPLRIDDFMPGTISLKYVIDLLTGTCVATIKSTKGTDHDDVLDSVIYSFQGNCATQIPITAQQFADSVRSSISLAASIGTMVATGGSAVPGMLASTVDNVMGIKPGIERSGAAGSSGSLLGVRTPYLILTRPRQAQPKRQNTYTGYPSFITEKLGDLFGYTELQEVHLENMTATDTEIAEITTLLKGGVIF